MYIDEIFLFCIDKWKFKPAKREDFSERIYHEVEI